MTTLKLTTGEWLGVTVPEGYIWKIWGDGKTLSGLEKSIGSISNKKHIDLPPGSSLPFPCVVGEMTEEMAEQVAANARLYNEIWKLPKAGEWYDYTTQELYQEYLQSKK